MNKYYDDIEEERNIIINRNKRLLNNGLKDFNECVDNKYYDFYEKEQEQLRILFNVSNIIYND